MFLASSKYKFALLICLFLSGAELRAQSSDPAFPTPVTSSDLSGVIKARDVGDARLTTYYYAFDGGQGDIFINVVSKNFTGDIDVFTETGLRPLTKIIVYGDAGTSENGRLVYLRRPERLILRVQGRPPGDEPATFQIKFAGSFVALSPAKDDKPPVLDEPVDSAVTVNSVGTIVAVKPKPRPTPKATPADEVPKADVQKEAETAKTESPRKPVVVVDEFPGTSDEVPRVKKPVEKPAPTRAARRKASARTRPVKSKPEPETEAVRPVDPLAGIRLVVTLKDGSVVEKLLTELVRFTFDKGVLTLVGKDGTIARYQMTDVAQVNVQ